MQRPGLVVDVEDATCSDAWHYEDSNSTLPIEYGMQEGIQKIQKFVSALRVNRTKNDRHNYLTVLISRHHLQKEREKKSSDQEAIAGDRLCFC